jgi:phosphoglycolate phosphatase
VAPLFDRVISGDTLPAENYKLAGIHAAFWCCTQTNAVCGQLKHQCGFGKQSRGDAIWARVYGYNMGKPVKSYNPDCVIVTFVASTTRSCQVDAPLFASKHHSLISYILYE